MSTSSVVDSLRASGWLPSRSEEPEHCWQDREIRFDVPALSLATRAGEEIVDTLEDVEDTKGNNVKSSKINLSIGYDAISSISTRTVDSRLRGQPTDALHLYARHGDCKLEFMFTSVAGGAHAALRLFTSVQGLYRSYCTSKVYRDLKVRSAVVQGGELIVLPSEQIVDKLTGVWNLSTEHGNLGIFFITTVRLVWFAISNEAFNVSIPYLQMNAVKLQNSRFGPALAIDTSDYRLGFRIDPAEKLKEVGKQIRKLWKVYGANPIFGVQYVVEEDHNKLILVLHQPTGQSLTITHSSVAEEDTFLLPTDPSDPADDDVVRAAVVALYRTDAPTRGGGDHEVVWDPDLGLAIERVRVEGVTLPQLWSLPSWRDDSELGHFL
ncbi:hypothetical protein BDK51DRAFT_27975, partial [Blyttiomyces helicus]